MRLGRKKERKGAAVRQHQFYCPIILFVGLTRAQQVYESTQRYASAIYLSLKYSTLCNMKIDRPNVNIIHVHNVNVLKIYCLPTVTVVLCGYQILTNLNEL